MLKLVNENSNFRNFLLFQTFSNIGGGIFGIFMMWAVHSQYQNPFYTGIAGLMFALPSAASFIIGPYVDMRNKVKIIRAACFAQVCAVALLLTVSNIYEPGVWFTHLMIFIVSVARIFDAPARTSLLPKIVSGEDLIKANALIRLVATVGGLGIGVLLYVMMYDGAGFEVVYGINTAVLFLALIFSFFVRGKFQEAVENKINFKAYFNELKVGLKFIKRGIMLHLMTAFVFMGLFANVSSVNLPMFAEVHTGSASGYILLVALAVVGGVIGPYLSKIVGPKFELWKIFGLGYMLVGATRIIFVNVIASDLSRALWIYVLYIGLGSTIGIFRQTFMQKYPPQHIIARVDTVETSVLSISAAAGALVGGIAGTLLPSVDMVFIIQGISCITIGLFLCLSKRVRKLPKISDVRPDEDLEPVQQ